MSVGTIADRVKKILEETPGLTMNEVDRRMQSYSNVETRGVTTRIVNGKRKYLHPETLARLARALNVSLDWLITGNGPKRVDGILREHDPFYPNRSKAIEIAREDGFSERAIEIVKSAKLVDGLTDMRVTDWLLCIKEEEEARLVKPT